MYAPAVQVGKATSASPAPTAIVSAMAQELAALLAHHEGDFTPQRHAGRDFHVGRLHGEPVVLVLCGVGKVAAATTTALLAERFGVRQLVFTGVAGGLGAQVRVGDVVVADTLLQHDMDASPLFPRWEVPLTGRSEFPADAALTEVLARAAAAVLAEPGHYGQAPAGQSTAECDAQARALGVHDPALHRGLVISGDRFVATAAESQALQAALPAALAVEMEGAAIAQVCHDLGLPFAVLRTISDRADDTAHVDFMRFIEVVAARASAAIVGRWLQAQGNLGA